MYELKIDELSKILEKEEPEGVDFFLMADESPYNGIESHRAALKKRKNFSGKSMRTGCICLPVTAAKRKQNASTPESFFLFRTYCAKTVTEIRNMTVTGFPTMKTAAKRYRTGMRFWSRRMGRNTDRKTSGGSTRSCFRTAQKVWKRMNGQPTGRIFLMTGTNGGARLAGAYTTATGTGLWYYWPRQQTDKVIFIQVRPDEF